MPTTDWYWNTLGVAYYRNGDFPAAIKALRKSGSRGWDDGLDSFFLAMAHWQSGHPNQARWWYVRGLDRQKPALPFAGTEPRRIREEAEYSDRPVVRRSYTRFEVIGRRGHPLAV